MDGKCLSTSSVDLGPSRFRAAEDVVVVHHSRAATAECLYQQVRRYAPRTPGVYAMFAANRRLIYVGKAKNLRCRLLSYFRINSRHPKAAKIIEQTGELVWETCGDEFAALLRELELIQTRRPRYNVQGVPGMQPYHYICIGQPPAPYVYVTSRPTGREIAVYGPLILRKHSAEAVRRLNDWFGLRDCPNSQPVVFRDTPDMFALERSPGCLRWELGTCSGVCVGACSRAAYTAAVRKAQAFLDGRDPTLLDQLRQAMVTAAQHLHFEKAAAIRDRLQVLERLDQKLQLLRQARATHAWIYPLQGPDGRERWYWIQRGAVRAVWLAPRQPADQYNIARELQRLLRHPPSPVVTSPAEVDSVLLVAGWFRRHPEEMKRILPAQQVLRNLRCRQDVGN